MATTALFPEGFTLAERYVIKRVIGQGGMGVVYLAEDTELDRQKRAIKVVRAELLQDPKGAVRLKKEAIASMSLSHPNIIRVFNYETWQNLSFIVMEFVEGQSLAHLLAEKDKLSEQEFHPYAKQLGSALEYAHSLGLIHQDIKPANIFIDKNNRMKIADFGIARVAKDTTTRLTGKQTSGTLLYMAPEVLKGSRPTRLSDIYSLGITFYEMLCGDPPFLHGDIYRLHLEAPVPAIDHISADLFSDITTMLNKAPEARTGSSFYSAKSVSFTAVDPQNRTAVQYYENGLDLMETQKYKEALICFKKARARDINLKDIIDPEIEACEKNLSEESKRLHESTASAVADVTQEAKQTEWNAREAEIAAISDRYPGKEIRKCPNCGLYTPSIIKKGFLFCMCVIFGVMTYGFGLLLIFGLSKKCIHCNNLYR